MDLGDRIVEAVEVERAQDAIVGAAVSATAALLPIELQGDRLKNALLVRHLTWRVLMSLPEHWTNAQCRRALEDVSWSAVQAPEVRAS